MSISSVSAFLERLSGLYPVSASSANDLRGFGKDVQLLKEGENDRVLESTVQVSQS